MNFENFAGGLLETVGDITGGIGDNQEAGGINSLAKAERNTLQNEITAAEHNSKMQRDKKMDRILEISIYSLIVIALLVTVVKLAPTIKRLFD
jgi:hypothetical protein